MSTNSVIYNFSDFTRENMRRLIQFAKKEYRFITYDEIESTKDFKTILWRHDVDFSIHSSLKLAQVEYEEGITATYFIWLQSMFYNTFEKEIYQKIRGILDLGHKIGLHLDSEYHDLTSEENIERAIKFEKETLERLFETKISVFSFHNPNTEVLKNTKSHYGGLINTYSGYFKNEVSYCSDSNGYWRHNRLEEVLKDIRPNRLQVLLHPVWWTDEVTSPKERIERAIYTRYKNNLNWYEDTLRKYGRQNIDWK